MMSGDLLIDPLLVQGPRGEPDRVLCSIVDRWVAHGWRVWLPTTAIAGLDPQGADRELVESLLKRVQWLAALADEASAIEDAQPRVRQLEIALGRLGDAATLVTRDPVVLSRVARARSPEVLDIEPVHAEKPFIDLATQQDRIRGSIERRIHGVLRHGHYIMGPEVAELEGVLARYVGVKHAIAVANGTDSLEIALRALGVGPGDEVITVPFTWISTAEVIGLVGAKPVFVDIEPASFNMDPRLLEAAITPRTKAVIAVGLFGQMPDIESISAIAQRHGVPVIEDGAQSFGATRHGKRSCSTTLIGSTSFFPAKPLGCYGDGGALFTQDDALAGRMRAIRTHGGERRHHHPYLGRNARLDTIQAAILLAKLECWSDEVEARERIGARYTSLLRGKIGVPEVMTGNTHVYAQYTIRVRQRSSLAESLKKSGIPTAVYYPTCLHTQPVFSHLGYRPGDFPASEEASEQVLSLPMHPYLEEKVQDAIVAGLLSAVVPDDASMLVRRGDARP